jgi:hypothetical protein
MNMDIELVNRAQYYAGLLKEDEDGGMTPLAARDRDDPKRKYLYDFCRSLYLATFLEALSEVPWTMGRRRGRLFKTTLPHGRSDYRFVYGLPYDCARPVEASGKPGKFPYAIDGGFLCTDAEKAELLYVSDGKIIPRDTEFEYVSAADFAEGRYDFVLSPGHVNEWDVPPGFAASGSPEEFSGAEASRPYEDYPEYSPPRYEAKFYEYLEMALAAKLAVKNVAQPRLHDTLMQKAMIIKQEAVAATKSVAADKDRPSPWWADRLGIKLGF